MVKFKSIKQAQGKLSVRDWPKAVWVGLALIIAGVVIVARALPASETSTTTDSGELKAVIVDQLYTLQANEEFIKQTTEELESYGFKVKVYQGDEITVDLYERLPLEGYQLIIFRAHAGTLSSTMMGDVVSTGSTYLFTDEAYVSSRYHMEQVTDQVLRAKFAEDYPEVFAVGAKFVEKSMQGRFQNTVIIMMGCSTMYSTDLAEALVNRGASVYLGWNGPVNLNYVDEATQFLLKSLCQDTDMEDAIETMNNEIGPDPEYLSYLKYYPTSSGNESIAELMQ